jgi:hypothetical protein
MTFVGILDLIVEEKARKLAQRRLNSFLVQVIGITNFNINIVPKIKIHKLQLKYSYK